jgi:hypothetical protein
MESDPGGATHLLYLPQPEDLQVSARTLERLLSSRNKWQFLYFFALPHQQGSFGSRLGFGLRLPVRKSKKRMFVAPPYLLHPNEKTVGEQILNFLTGYILSARIMF